MIIGEFPSHDRIIHINIKKASSSFKDKTVFIDHSSVFKPCGNSRIFDQRYKSRIGFVSDFRQSMNQLFLLDTDFKTKAVV
jgi:hypothetical protein